MRIRPSLVLLTLIPCLLGIVGGADWPAASGDNRRSGVTDQQLELPLKSAWTFKSPSEPRPAWPDPAKQNYWHRLYNLRSTVAFDRAFHVIGDDDRLYFGSSADCKLYCLSAETGEVLWTFFTNGPIRLAPAVYNGRVYLASDDGCLYCLAAETGKLSWKYSPPETARLIPGNGRIISTAAIRSGVVVDSDTVYFTAGLFPSQGAQLIALDAGTGAVKQSSDLSISPQGYMLASEDLLYVPTGRTSPMAFARSDFKSRGEFASAGGAYAVLADDVLVTGPGRGAKEIKASDPTTRAAIATFDGLRMVIKDNIAHMQSETKLSALDRKRYLQLARERNTLSDQAGSLEKQIKANPANVEDLKSQLQTAKQTLAQIDQDMKACYLWTVDTDCPFAMIAAGEHLLLGGDGKIAAIDTKTGGQVFTAGVTGIAHSLAVFSDALYVSTDAGVIHCFAAEQKGAARQIAAEVAKSPYRRDNLTALYRKAAKSIVKTTAVTQGYCLVLDSDRGRLAYELAKRTDLKIVAVEDDPAKVTASRKSLDLAGLHGQVIVLQGPVAKLNLTSFFANLVVSDAALSSGRAPSHGETIRRLIRPDGGTLCIGQPEELPPKVKRLSGAQWVNGIIGEDFDVVESPGNWTVFVRGALPGGGQWTHLHADPAGTACSNDKLIEGPVSLQWFGQPGPTEMIDRHHRNVAPLCKDGRLFVPGDQIIYAVDAYNGTVLWDVRTPDSRRLGVFLDSSNIALDDKALYLASKDKCDALDVKTGDVMTTYRIPAAKTESASHWGYVACTSDTIFGSTCRPDAAYTETSYAGDNALWYRNMQVVTSDSLFAVSKKTGNDLWTYENKSLILNTTIVIGPDHIYFIETDSVKAMENELGRMPISTLFDGGAQYLTALDIRTGKIAFRKQIDTTNLEEPVYLNYAHNTLLLSGSKLDGTIVRYYYFAFDAGSAGEIWTANHNSELARDGGHGEYNRHPTIVDKTIYAWPYAYELKTGARVEGWKFNRMGHGCGGVSASANAMFWRGHNPWMQQLSPDAGPTRLNTVTRPGCWINIIPAAGLVLIPEASSGCTCGYSLQTSLAYIPQSLLN